MDSGQPFRLSVLSTDLDLAFKNHEQPASDRVFMIGLAVGICERIYSTQVVLFLAS